MYFTTQASALLLAGFTIGAVAAPVDTTAAKPAVIPAKPDVVPEGLSGYYKVPYKRAEYKRDGEIADYFVTIEEKRDAASATTPKVIPTKPDVVPEGLRGYYKVPYKRAAYKRDGEIADYFVTIEEKRDETSATKPEVIPAKPNVVPEGLSGYYKVPYKRSADDMDAYKREAVKRDGEIADYFVTIEE